MRPVSLLFAVAAAVVTLTVPASGGADNPVLFASVGRPTSPDAFYIAITDASGNPVKHLQPGTYQINVQDYATLHNFHLTGPGGVDKSTEVDTVSTAVWTVTFTNGSYHYQCDAHPSLSHDFVAGTVLHGQVGPKRAISLRDQAGARVKSLPAGTYPVIVKDASRTDNFHLTGPGLNKKTGVRSRGTSNWRLSLKTGTYRFRSDAHKRLSSSFSVQ